VVRKGRKKTCFLGHSLVIHSYPQVINIKKWVDIFPPHTIIAG